MGGMGMMIRRFVNIVAERGYSGMYTLHRLDVSKHLFHPSRAAAEAANKTNGKVPILPWLPAPVMRFEPSPTILWDAARLEMFALVSPRTCEDRVFCSNSAGHTTLYNADGNCIQAMPSLNGGKGFMPMAFYVKPDAPEDDLYVKNTAPEEDLYVMNAAGNLEDGSSCFDVLRFGSLGSGGGPIRRRGWYWDPLPPPPFAANICSHTVVDGGSTICVSAVQSSGAARTYCFDTVKQEWTQVAGGWLLPFDGAAEYVPDLSLWMGFSTDSQQLCAWDLSAMDKPPALKHSWIDLKTPEDWSASTISLVNLGAGRFCIAKTFVLSGTGESFDVDSIKEKFAVLTGIEMVTSGVGRRCDNDLEEGLKMVRHKSIRYMFSNEMRIRFVL